MKPRKATTCQQDTPFKVKFNNTKKSIIIDHLKKIENVISTTSSL